MMRSISTYGSIAKERRLCHREVEPGLRNTPPDPQNTPGKLAKLRQEFVAVPVRPDSEEVVNRRAAALKEMNAVDLEAENAMEAVNSVVARYSVDDFVVHISNPSAATADRAMFFVIQARRLNVTNAADNLKRRNEEAAGMFSELAQYAAQPLRRGEDPENRVEVIEGAFGDSAEEVIRFLRPYREQGVAFARRLRTMSSTYVANNPRMPGESDDNWKVRNDGQRQYAEMLGGLAEAYENFANGIGPEQPQP